MNYFLATITLLSLIFLIIREVSIWKYRVILSPAFAFAIMWLFGALGILILYPAGLMLAPYPQYINELNILISFTAVSFCFWSKNGSKSVAKTAINLDISSIRIYTLLSVILLVAAIYDFISLGSNINMGAARYNLRAIEAARSTFVTYSSTLCCPLSIYAGYQVTVSLQNGHNKYWGRWLMPLLANLILSIDVGGRVDFVYSFLYYLIGASFSIPLNSSLKQNKKFVITTTIACVATLIFISSVSSQRSEYQYGEIGTAQTYLKSISPMLGYLYGPVAYVTSTYEGYQLRRADNVDLNHLGHGMYTFNGFINWTLPFSDKLGLKDFSIANAFDIKYNVQETNDSTRVGYYLTHSSYLTIIKDFGFRGGLICIFMLTFISHRLFVRIQKRQSILNSVSLFFFVLFWTFWAKSFFYCTLSSTILIPLYGYLILDICALIAKK